MVEHDSVGHSAAMTAPRVGRAELGTVRLDQGSELDPEGLDQGCWQQRHGLSRRSSGLQQSHDHLWVRASTCHDTPRASCAGRSKYWPSVEFAVATARPGNQMLVLNAGRLPTGLPDDLVYRGRGPARSR